MNNTNYYFAAVLALVLIVGVCVDASTQRTLYGRKGTRDEKRLAEILPAALNRASQKRQGSGAAQFSPSNTLTAPPVRQYPDINPQAFAIPAGAPTIKMGRTWTATQGSPQEFYAITEEQGFSTAVYIINSNGGVTINGTQYYIEMITYNDGAECANMVILYERLIAVDQVHLLFNPVHYACTEIALLAEAYQIPIINTADYSLDEFMDTNPSYANLFWTFSLTANYSTVGAGTVTPAYIAGARTYAIMYNPEIPFYGPQGEAAAQALGMRPVINTTLLSLAAQAKAQSDPTAADNCSYVNQFVDQLILAQPDMFMFTFSSYSDAFIDCMHRKQYHPPAFWNIAGAAFTGQDVWQTAGAIGETLWVRTEIVADPFLVSNQNYEQVFSQLWNISTVANDIGYQATHGAGVSIACQAVRNAQNLGRLPIVQALAALDTSTIIGPIYMINNGLNRRYYHPYYATQRPLTYNGTIVIVYPENVPGVQNLTYPVTFDKIVPQFYLDFLASLQPHGLSSTAWGLIGMSIGVVVVAIAVGVGYLIFRHYNHMIIIPKSPQNEEWGTGGMEV
jgi:hypothetical protein